MVALVVKVGELSVTTGLFSFEGEASLDADVVNGSAWRMDARCIFQFYFIFFGLDLHSRVHDNVVILGPVPDVVLAVNLIVARFRNQKVRFRNQKVRFRNQNVRFRNQKDRFSNENRSNSETKTPWFGNQKETRFINPKYDSATKMYESETKTYDSEIKMYELEAKKKQEI